MTQLRIFSYGGGVQSTAALILAAQEKIDFPTFLFCNVGNDSEHPATLEYVQNIAIPYAEVHGIDLRELRKRKGRKPHKGESDKRPYETVYERVMSDSRSISIPAYSTFQGGAPMHRKCTGDFKIKQVNSTAKTMGASAKEPAQIGLGISVDEFQRMSTDPPETPYVQKVYPLVDLRITRQDCENIIRGAGLPVPPKSSCYFCPFHSLAAWQKLKRETPELFDRAVAIEQRMNQKRAALGRDYVWLSRKLIPLDQAIGDQSDMFDDTGDTCESGFCMV